jgi:YfiR/HmsC-like
MMASVTTARHSAPASSSSVRGWRKHSAKHWYKAGLVVCLLLASAAGQVQRADEDRVKAAYLYNFAKFVEWPATSFAGTDSSMLICSIGDERLAEALQQMARGKQAQGRTIEVRQVVGLDQLKSCRILLIAFRDKERIAPILRSVQLANILTVGQSEEFIRLGGIINLVRNENSIELEINPNAAETAGLKISSRLLAVSRVVASPPGGGNRE